MVRRLGGRDLGNRSRRCQGKSAPYPRTERRHSRQPGLLGGRESLLRSKITVPTLLVQAEWDRDLPPYMPQTLFPLLVNSPGKRYVMLAEGTHTIIMEKNRLQLFEAVETLQHEARTAL